MGPYIFPSASLSVLISPSASVWILKVVLRPYKSLFVFRDSNGSLWVVIGP